MGLSLQDPVTKVGVRVNDNRESHTFSVTETEHQFGTEQGDAYNINTDWITGISGVSGLVYFKNNNERVFVLSAIAVGVGNADATDVQSLYLYHNPTGGTLISAALATTIQANRKVGSNKELSTKATVYTGVNGSTVTGGAKAALFGQNDFNRGFFAIDFDVEQGGSIAVTIEPDLDSGTVKAYIALIGFFKDPGRS